MGQDIIITDAGLVVSNDPAHIPAEHDKRSTPHMKRNNIETILLLTLLSAFPPLSTDMYLPALPLLQRIWQVPMSTVNLTLTGFFVGYCISLLLYGPLSDKLGRKPPLFAGITLYVMSSFLSGYANDIVVLILLRVLQGIGSASGVVIAMAITKDLYQGHERQRILAYMGIIMALAPMFAPVLGGLIMQWFSWHWVFFAQAAMGAIAFGGVVRMEEPLKKPTEGSMLAAMGMYLTLLRNRRYMTLVVLFSIIVLPHFSFIGSAANLYINRFGTSEQVFSYFFAFNALAIMAGSFLCSRIQKRMTTRQLMSVSFAGILVAGIVMYVDLLSGPWGLALPMAIASFSFGISRPTSNHIILEQTEKGAGAASSLMIFLFFLMGAFAMWFISLDWANTIHTLALLAMLSGGGVLVVWMLASSLSSAETIGREKI
jgi:DHA1 family bicyclomycin/chloramphenicol resistance-like MFS transporter